MASFRFKLESVLKYRRSRRDVCRQRLARLFHEERELAETRERLEDRRQQLLDEIKELGKRGRVDIDGSASRRYYVGRLLGEIAGVEQRRQAILEEIRHSCWALVRADQDVKVLEKLEEKQKNACVYDENRKHAIELEEMWSAGRIRESVT